MKVKDLNGIESNWNLAKASVRDNPSGLHLRCRELLKVLYPTAQILEEVPIKTDRISTLYLDFYLPLHKLAIEVHGEQHYKFVPHFHENIMGFIAGKKRDESKIKWCKLNGIKVKELPYNEDDDKWTKRLLTTA